MAPPGPSLSCAAEGRQRDLFPLPFPVAPAVQRDSFVSLGSKCRRRVLASVGRGQSCRDAVSALNQLHFGGWSEAVSGRVSTVWGVLPPTWTPQGPCLSSAVRPVTLRSCPVIWHLLTLVFCPFPRPATVRWSWRCCGAGRKAVAKSRSFVHSVCCLFPRATDALWIGPRRNLIWIRV